MSSQKNSNHPQSAAAIQAKASQKLQADKDALSRRIRNLNVPTATTTSSSGGGGGANAGTTRKQTAVEIQELRKYAVQQQREKNMSLSGKLYRIIEYLKVSWDGGGGGGGVCVRLILRLLA